MKREVKNVRLKTNPKILRNPHIIGILRFQGILGNNNKDLSLKREANRVRLNRRVKSVALKRNVRSVRLKRRVNNVRLKRKVEKR